MKASEDGSSSRRLGIRPSNSASSSLRYGLMLVPPWMISSRFGRSSGKDLPLSSQQRFSSRMIQGGTPEMIRMELSESSSSAMACSFSSQGSAAMFELGSTK